MRSILKRRSLSFLPSRARAWLGREDSAVGLGAFSLVAGVFASLLLSVGDKGALGSLPGRAALAAFLALSCFGVALALQLALRRRTLRLPAAVAGATVVSYALADTYFRGLFKRHVVFADFATGLDAVRTGAVPLSALDLVVLLASFVLLAFVSYVLLSALAHLPGPRLDRGGASAAAIFAALYVLFYFRDLWSSGALPRDWLGGALHVHGPEQAEERIEPGARVEFRLGPTLQEQLFAGIVDVARQPTLGATASRTPDIVFVHAESLRADHFRPELFPETFARTKDCLHASRHYATGNTTANGLFGVLSGLSPVYFELARKAVLTPLPLRALREIGYGTHVFYPNEALDFDQLLGTMFGERVEVHRVSREPVHEADALTVEAFERERAEGGPRFDYVLLDSSHYDYSYPPRYERFTPSGTLGVRFNPRTGEGLEVISADAAKGKEDKVRNRYKNSLLYVDSLLARLLDRARGRERPTVVVLFGDHGEALFDKDGRFGHSTELSEAQTRVPAVLCFPSAVETSYRISSHADVFPTLFDWMGLRSSARFMTGKSLLTFDPSLDWAIARGPVTSREASRRYLIADEHHRTGILQQEPPIVQWVEDANERELAPAPADVVARAFAEFLLGASLRSPEVRPRAR